MGAIRGTRTIRAPQPVSLNLGLAAGIWQPQLPKDYSYLQAFI